MSLHDAGASEVDALAVAVATGVAYLRHLETEGITAATAFVHTEFRLSATADQFLTAASLRALRRVWARVGEACGVPEELRAGTHAVTSLRMFSREDPWVNVLRSTLAAFGASVGGAEAITVLPYDTVAGLPERFSRRLARNTQILLCDESNVGRSPTPAAGRVPGVAHRPGRRRGVGSVPGGRGGRWRRHGDRGRPAPHLGVRRHLRAGPRPGDPAPPLTGVSTFPLAGEVPLTRRPVATRAAPAWLSGPTATPRPTRPCATARGRSGSARPSSSARSGPSATPVPGRRSWPTSSPPAASPRPSPAHPSPSSRPAPAATPSTPARRWPTWAAGADVVLIAGRAHELGDDAALVDGELHDGMDVVAVLDTLLTHLETEGAR